ncbi:Hypothetical protein, putative [Bodo saltans]|uniref:Uncharacterized protein n=1 Tax=Bodo saltans TaxID=75058 RepID=A0A0S4JNX9_BODSA|nr:Hypothetical protein, putative [Bodo saltans]|eukprot:CUG91923.1 Hypothetical protein, putative [Bodo saltans]
MEAAVTITRGLISAVFVGFGIVHFLPKPLKTMSKMIPPVIVKALRCSPAFLVKFTGVCEIAGGIGIQLPQTRWLAGVMLSIFCVCVFPANYYASSRPEQFGKFAIPLKKRLPAQIILIALILWATTTRYAGLE